MYEYEEREGVVKATYKKIGWGVEGGPILPSLSPAIVRDRLVSFGTDGEDGHFSDGNDRSAGRQAGPGAADHSASSSGLSGGTGLVVSSVTSSGSRLPWIVDDAW